MSQYYNQQYSNGPPGGNQYYPSQHQTNPAGYAGSQAGYYSASPQSAYRPPQDDQYRRASTQQNMQVGPYEDDYDYDDRPRQHHHHHHDSTAGYSNRSRSHDRSRGSFDEVRRGSGTPPVSKPNHSTQKKLGATVLGGAVGAFAAHELGHGHHDVATVVGGLAGAWAGNKLEKKHEEKKEREQLRRASEAGVGVGGAYLARDEERRSSRDVRRYDDDGSDSDSSDGSRRRRHHHQH